MPHSASLGSMAAAIFEAVTSGTLEPRAMILAGVMWANCQDSLGCGMGAGMDPDQPGSGLLIVLAALGVLFGRALWASLRKKPPE